MSEKNGTARKKQKSVRSNGVPLIMALNRLSIHSMASDLHTKFHEKNDNLSRNSTQNFQNEQCHHV